MPNFNPTLLITHMQTKDQEFTLHQQIANYNPGTYTRLPKVWLVSAEMGYGHLRAVYPLKELAKEGVMNVGEDKSTRDAEKKLWRRILHLYEWLSRARGIPWIGKYIFQLLDFFLCIPSFYPRRDLSHSTFQVKMLASSINKGLCSGMTEKIQQEKIPLVTSFYAPAIAADNQGYETIYCIICDSDLNRVWVNQDPWESRIHYFAPCGNAARRLKAYGVPENRIHLTGFPLPIELTGNRELEVLKKDLGQRLHYLDPHKRFWSLHSRNLTHFLGEQNCVHQNNRVLTLTYAVGGAGAQKETGGKIAHSLKNLLHQKQIILNLAAGTRPEVKDYFLDIKEEIASENINIISGKTFENYYHSFNHALKTTDILWSKPSELSFYTGLGIPFIMSPCIGAQERANKKWIQEIQAGFKQENPEYTDQWLMDLVRKGRLAEAAWAGFLKARKRGTYNIMDCIVNGSLSYNPQPIR